MDKLGKIFYMKFLRYSHWFMSIRISQLKDHYMSVYQDRYAASVVEKHLVTVTMNKLQIFIRHP